MSLIEYRFRLRNAANSADVLVATSVRGDPLAYISTIPHGDGASLDPYTGRVMSGEYTGNIIDGLTGAATRVFTSLMEDAGQRQQLGQRRAFWEYRVDGGAWIVLYAGRLSAYRLVTDIEWSITVSDWMQAESEYKLFQPSASTELITSFLARYPNRGCIIGGPMGSVLGVKDLGGWIMRVRNATPAGATRVRYRLEPADIYNIFGGFGRFEDMAGAINKSVRELPVTPSEFGLGTYTTIADTQSPGFGWSGLVVLVDGVPWRGINRNAVSLRDGSDSDWDFASVQKGKVGIHIDTEGQAPLTLDSLVKVRCLTVLPTPSSPLYLQGHPIDILNQLEAEAGIPVNAASVTSIKNIIGASAELTLRIVEPTQLGPLLEEAIYGPFGVGARPDDLGAIEYFSSRSFANTPPGVVITSVDVVDETVTAFELDVKGAIREMNFEHRIMTKTGATAEGIIESTQRFERANGDPSAIGTGVVDFKVPGMVNFKNANFNLKGWVDARAHEIFDRRGRGDIRARMTLLRNGTGGNAKLGDELTLQLPQIPNHNKRYGDDNSVGGRCMQIVHWTPVIEGIDVELEDSGPNVQPLATLPTMSIALSVGNTLNTPQYTITNAAALVALGYAVRVQIAITAGGAPALTDYTDFAYFPNAEIPTIAVLIPYINAGLSVYVRARSEKGDARPSNWSVGVNVTLDALNAPSGVSATPSGTDGTICALAWTPGANAVNCHTNIFIRTQGSLFSTATFRDTLAPGTKSYTLRKLLQGALLTATIQHRNLQTGDIAQTDVNFTAGATVVALPAPVTADAFCTPIAHSGRIDPNDAVPNDVPSARGIQTRLPRYGLVVKATVFPSDMEFAEAVETGVGTGVYGAYTTVARMPSVSGAWTRYVTSAAIDGLRRKLKARHVADNYTPSAYTAEFVITLTTHDPEASYVIDFSADIFLGTIEDPLIGSVGAGKLGLGGSSTGIPSPITDNGGRAVNRFFGKVLSGDPDTADGVPTGTTFQVPKKSAQDGSGNIDLNGAGWINKHSGNLPRSAGDPTPIGTIVGNIQNSGHLASGMQESGGKPVNRMFGKVLAGDPDTADGIPTGTNFQVPKKTAQDASGNIDLSGGGWVNKHSGNLPRSAIDPTTVGTIVGNIQNSGHLASGMQESGGKAVNRMFGKVLAGDPDTLDSAADGATYKKVLGVGSGKITDTSVAANVGLSLFDNGDKGANFTIDWNNGNIQRVRLTGSGITVTLSNPGSGRVYTIIFKQDGTGSRALPTFSPAAIWGDAGAPVWNIAANKYNIISLLYNGVDGVYHWINSGTGF